MAIVLRDPCGRDSVGASAAARTGVAAVGHRAVHLLLALAIIAGGLLVSPAKAQSAWVTPGAPAQGMVSTTAVAISWTPVWGAPRYLVKYSTSKSWTSPKYVRTSEPTAELTGLKAGTTYYVKVAVARTTGSKLSKYGKTSTVRTQSSASSYTTLTPGGLRADAYDADSVTLTWQARSGAARYQVKYGTDAAISAPTYLSTTATTLTVKGLKKSTNYWFKLRTKNSKGTATSTFGTRLKVTTTSSEAIVPLRAATYNVLCANCNSSYPWSTRRASLVAAIKAQNLDVLGAQEASPGLTTGADGTKKAQFDDLLELLGSNYALTNAYRYNCEKSTSPNNCTVKNRGASHDVRIIYNVDRVALLRQGSLEYDAQDPSDTKRFMAWAELKQKSSGKRFFVANTHLDPNDDASGSTYHYKLRAAQTSELLAEIKKHNTSGLPVVILGDFKSSKYASPSNAPYDVITDAGYLDPLGNTYKSTIPARSATVESRVGTEYNTKNNLTKSPPRSAYINGSVIDYVYVSPSVRVQQWQTVVDVTAAGTFAAKPPSDHNMVRVTLYLP
ncbi:fibronectin type III domain-containing protein [Micropruina sp.]|uniref:fibronectin type III domain-containing protein n=1 Tax=Micropruina sp. TaxID=2737536 RepID=UPI0039E380C6